MVTTLNLGALGFNWLGPYNVETTYKKNDIARYIESTYVYINNVPSAGNDPTDVAYWELFTQGSSGGTSTVFGRGGDVIAQEGDYSFDLIDGVSENVLIGRLTAGTGVQEALTAAEVRTFLGIEDGATADQTDSEIETAYNNQVPQITASEITAASEVAVRRFSPADMASLISQHAAGGGGGLQASNNLSDIPDIAVARENLELEPGVDVQSYNAVLSDIKDEDDMASDNDQALATQQSIKAYVDAMVAGGSGIILQVLQSTTDAISTISKSSLPTPQSGHNQSAGTSSHFVPGAMPSSGQPLASS